MIKNLILYNEYINLFKIKKYCIYKYINYSKK